jgi:periplasmic protein TonB
MTAHTVPWFEDDRRDLVRWATAAFAVVCLHVAVIAAYLFMWHAPNEQIGDESSVISIELTAPQIDQLEQPQIEKSAPPKQQVEKPVSPKQEVEKSAPPKQQVEKPTPPQQQPAPLQQQPAPPQQQPTPPKQQVEKPVSPKQEVEKPALSKQQVEKPAPPKVEHSSPSARTTVREIARAPRIDLSWESVLLKRLQEFKKYPLEARRQREQGVVLLAFSVDREGRVVSRHIVKGSGFPDLDGEALALVLRAQPLPAFPPSMTAVRLNLTVPIRFSLR